jgi:hypothetical protein
VLGALQASDSQALTAVALSDEVHVARWAPEQLDNSTVSHKVSHEAHLWTSDTWSGATSDMAVQSAATTTSGALHATSARRHTTAARAMYGSRVDTVGTAPNA